MSDWSEGYVTAIDYTYGYYREQAPLAMCYSLNAAGFEAPPMERFRYCELGFGQGAGLNLLAAAYPNGEFWGTDFNPAHVAGAERIAANVGLKNVHFFDDSFEQFVKRDLPQFDFIALHGIWSWISPQNRKAIVDFLGKNLKVGGAVYVSYNTLPGWTHALPMRGLLSQHVEQQGSPSEPIAQRFDNAMKMLSELSEVPTSYFKQTPQLADRIKHLQTQNKSYLVHEYLNQNWTPMFFSQTAHEMEAAKLTFAAHANVMNCVDALNHSKELQAILDRITNPTFKELVRDYGINQTFRRDIYVRGPRRLHREEHASLLLDRTYALTVPRTMCSLKIKTQAGEATLQPAVYDAMLDVLAKEPATGRSMLSLPAVAESGGAGRLLQALVVLVGVGYIQPCVDAAHAKAAAEPVARFNQYIMNRSAQTPEGELLFLASPLLASGLPQPRVTQLMLRAMQSDPKGTAESWARSVWSVLRVYGQALRKDNATIEGEDANVRELTERINDWQRQDAMVLRNLRMI